MSSNRGQGDKSPRLSHQFTSVVPKTSVIYLLPLKGRSWGLCPDDDGRLQTEAGLFITSPSAGQQNRPRPFPLTPCQATRCRLGGNRSFHASDEISWYSHFENVVENKTVFSTGWGRRGGEDRGEPASLGRKIQTPQDRSASRPEGDLLQFTQTICVRGEDKQEAPSK